MRRAVDPSDEAVSKHPNVAHIAKPHITKQLLSLLSRILVPFLCINSVLPLHLPYSTLLLHGLLVFVIMIVLSEPCSGCLLLSDFKISEVCFEYQRVPGSLRSH